jgi:hypothetical protein
VTPEHGTLLCEEVGALPGLPCTPHRVHLLVFLISSPLSSVSCQAGTYVVRLDNRHSIFRSKTVHYLVDVVSPDRDHVEATPVVREGSDAVTFRTLSIFASSPHLLFFSLSSKATDDSGKVASV